MKKVLFVVVALLVASCGPSVITGRFALTAPSESFDEIGDPVLVDGDLAFPVKKNGEAFVFWRGQELGKGVATDVDSDGNEVLLNRIYRIIDYRGTPAWVVGHSERINRYQIRFGQNFFLVLNGNLEASRTFIHNDSLLSIGNSLMYVAADTFQQSIYSDAFVVADGVAEQKFGFLAVTPALYTEVAGEIAYYPAYQDFVIHGVGNEREDVRPSSPDFRIREVYDVAEIKGDLAFTAWNRERSDKTGFLYYRENGQEIIVEHPVPGQFYGRIRFPLEVNGEIGYVGMQNPGRIREESSLIVVGDQEIGTRFDRVLHGISYSVRGKTGGIEPRSNVIDDSPPLVIGGKLTFLGSNNNQAFAGQDKYWMVRWADTVIVHGDQELGAEYTFVCCHRDIDGKVAYKAVIGPNEEESPGSDYTTGFLHTVAIVYDGNEIGGRFDEVTEPQVSGNNIVFLGRKGSSWEVVSAPLT